MKNLCIIPARGGSKRIPRKNIKDFLGKPIISYPIEIAVKSHLFEEIMVSTDDEEISEVAIKYGAKVPFKRSSKNSDDLATTFDVLEEVINYYRNEKREFDNICCIYPCNPLLSLETLKFGYEKLLNEYFESVITLVKYSNPIQRAFRLDNDRIQLMFPEFEKTRSQELESAYFDAGQFYWLKTNKLLESKRIFSEYSGGIIIDEMLAQDIDNESDWSLAEMKYKLLNT